MKGWTKAAWISSWVAPYAGALTLISLALALAAERDTSTLAAFRHSLHAGVLLFAAISVITHAILLYRVQKGTGLTAKESAQFSVHLKFGFGYAEWRKAIRRNIR